MKNTIRAITIFTILISIIISFTLAQSNTGSVAEPDNLTGIIPPRPVRRAGESTASYSERVRSWQAEIRRLTAAQNQAATATESIPPRPSRRAGESTASYNERIRSWRAEVRRLTDNRFINEEIVNMYNELISLRQEAVAESRRLVEFGQGNMSDVVELETKAAEARIQLAQFQGKKEIVIEELQKLVKVMTDLRNTRKREVEIGQRPQLDIYEIDAQLLETKIRLATLKQ